MKRPTICITLLSLVLAIVTACHRVAPQTSLTIISIEQVVNRDDPSYDICADFKIDNQGVIKYFQMAKSVGAAEFNEKSIILPCRYQGKIEREGKTYSWEIIAGGAGYLYDDAETVNERYLCTTDICCEKMSGLCR